MKNGKGFFLLFLILSACVPSKGAQQATITQIAADVLATQKAAVNVTDTPVPLPTGTPTLRPSEIVYATPTEQPDGVLMGLKTAIKASPKGGSSLVAHLFQGDSFDVLGRSMDCTYLKVQDKKQNIGWIYNNPEEIELNLDCQSLPEGSFRPNNGTIVFDKREETGMGELKIDNGSVDGVVILADINEDPMVAIYIRSGGSHLLEEIPDGMYYLFFSTGEEWIDGEKRFTENVNYQKFEDSFSFATTATTYSAWSVTLFGVSGGQAETNSLSADDFPSISE